MGWQSVSVTTAEGGERTTASLSAPPLLDRPDPVRTPRWCTWTPHWSSLVRNWMTGSKARATMSVLAYVSRATRSASMVIVRGATRSASMVIVRGCPGCRRATVKVIPCVPAPPVLKKQDRSPPTPPQRSARIASKAACTPHTPPVWVRVRVRVRVRAKVRAKLGLSLRDL